MHVAFFENGPHEPPLITHSMDAIPRVGEKVLLRTHYDASFEKYVVEDVEWVPWSGSVNVDVRKLSSFG